MQAPQVSGYFNKPGGQLSRICHALTAPSAGRAGLLMTGAVLADPGLSVALSVPRAAATPARSPLVLTPSPSPFCP